MKVLILFFILFLYSCEEPKKSGVLRANHLEFIQGPVLLISKSGDIRGVNHSFVSNRPSSSFTYCRNDSIFFRSKGEICIIVYREGIYYEEK